MSDDSEQIDRLHQPPDSVEFDWSEVGSAPGTLRGDEGAKPSVLTTMVYGPDGAENIDVSDLQEAAELSRNWENVWIDIRGVGDLHMLESAGEVFDIPTLVLEDIQSHPQRTKAEFFKEGLFIVSHVAHWESGLEIEEVAIWMEPGLVVTFHELETKLFTPIRRRIREARGKIRKKGADYLTYAILDTVIDRHYPVLEQLGHRLDELDDEIIRSRETDLITGIHSVKQNADTLHHSIRPQCDMIGSLLRRNGGQIEEDTVVYLRDCHDHAHQISEIASRYHETANSLMSLYLSLSSHRLNEVMKVLTIVGTIFIPLTFIAGLYGMNFDPEASPWNMPELSWYWGYPASLGLMLVIGIMLTIYFWRKGWIGPG